MLEELLDLDLEAFGAEHFYTKTTLRRLQRFERQVDSGFHNI